LAKKVNEIVANPFEKRDQVADIMRAALNRNHKQTKVSENKKIAKNYQQALKLQTQITI
jgi:hypothetical protein